MGPCWRPRRTQNRETIDTKNDEILKASWKVIISENLRFWEANMEARWHQHRIKKASNLKWPKSEQAGRSPLTVDFAEFLNDPAVTSGHRADR